MKRRIAPVFIALAVVVFAARLLANDPAREQKLQQAIDLIESKGDIARAIPLLEDVSKSTDRALAARALLYLAQTQERTNKNAARTTYQRIDKEFGDQREAAASARAHLAQLAEPQLPDSLTDRVVLPTRLDRFQSSMVTRDGRLLLFPDFATGGPAIRDIASNKVTYLASGPASDNIAPRLSPDGTRISYEWAGTVNGRTQQEIRVVGTQSGSKPKTVWPTAAGAGDVREAIPREWSGDGKSILIDMQRKDQTWQFAWLNADTGDLRVLKSTDWTRPDDPGDRRPSLSPDGRYLVYSALSTNPARPEAPPAEAADERIYILAVDGSSEVPLTAATGVNRQPIWTADGSHVLFLSGRASTIDLWAIAVERGKPKGKPLLLKRDIGFMTPIGMTSAGVLYYVKDANNKPEVLISDLKTLQTPVGEGARVMDPLFSARYTAPTWSPNGKSIAVLQQMPDNRVALVVRSLDTGNEIRFAPAGRDTIGGASALWLHDGSELLVMVGHADEKDPDGRPGQVRSLYRASLKSGQLTEITGIGRFLGSGAFGMELAPDDRTLYVQGAFSPPAPSRPPFRAVTAVDLTTAERRTVMEVPEGHGILGLALSPDGRALALCIANVRTLAGRLVRVGVDGQDYRELTTFDSFMTTRGPTWSPDSKAVFYWTGDPGRPTRIMRISAEGGAPQVQGEIDGLTSMSLSPVGTRLAFAKTGPSTELHALENVLSALKALR